MSQPAARRPTVVVFHCDGGSLATPEVEPACPGAGFIRVPCVGRVPAGDVLRALRAGAAGVLLAGCAPGECRFHHAVDHAAEVATDLAPVLAALGLGDGRVRYAPVGRGAALEAAVADFCGAVSDLAVLRPEPAEAARRSALVDVQPPFPHHRAVQEVALLSQSSQEIPAWPAWGTGAKRQVETLLYVCDLPLLDGLLGRHFPARTHDTLRACLALLGRAGVPVAVVPTLPCCGHDFALAGAAAHLAPEARRVRSAIHATGARQVVTVSPECEAHLRDGYAALDARLEPRVIGLPDLLYEHRAALVPDAPRPANDRVVLYVGDATAASRDSALELLAVAGVTPRVVLPLEYPPAGAGPPGSAGVRGFVRCDGEARAAQDRLLAEVTAQGATTLITLSVIAAIHLGCALRRGSWRRSGVRVETLFDHLAARLAAPAVSSEPPERQEQ